MNCAKVKRWLHLYAPEELSPRQRKAMAKHMETCVTCQTLSREIEELRLSVDVTRRAVPDLAEPSAFTDRIMSAIEHQPHYDRPNTRFRSWQWVTKPRFRLACGVLLIFNVVILFIQEIQVTNRVLRLERKMVRPVSVPKSVLTQCMDSVQDFEKFVFNREMADVIQLIRSGSVENELLNRHSFQLRQISLDQRLKIIKACRQLNGRHRFYQSPKQVIN